MVLATQELFIISLGQVAQVLVTVEKAGGRVVSLQERLLLVSLR